MKKISSTSSKWFRRKLNPQVNIGEDLPKLVQVLRKNVLVPARKKARRDPRNKAHVHVSSDKVIINGKAYFHYNIPAGWLPSDRGDQEEEEDEDTPALNDITGHTMVE